VSLQRRAGWLLLGGFGVGLALIRSRRARTKSTAPTVPVAPEASTMYDIAKLSYDEVLDATKHQDDKIGRFLTAIAFLTGATIAFGTRPDVITVQYNLDRPTPLPAALALVFVILIGLTLTVLLIGLGQALTIPGSARQRTPTEPDRPRSLLFFMSIADWTLPEWEKAWNKSGSELRSDVTNQFIRESHNLATRADKKYRRTGEAQSLFTLSLLAFVLAAVLALNALARPTAGVTPWDLRPRVLAATVIASFTVALAYGWFRFEQDLKTKSLATTRLLYLLPLASALYPFAMILPPRVIGTGWGALIVAITFTFSTFVAFARWKPLSWPWWVCVFSGLVITVLSVAVVLASWDQWRFVLASLLCLWLESPHLFGNWISWRIRTKRHDSRAAHDTETA
jgi:hypothetical protein